MEVSSFIQLQFVCEFETEYHNHHLIKQNLSKTIRFKEVFQLNPCRICAEFLCNFEIRMNIKI